MKNALVQTIMHCYTMSTATGAGKLSSEAFVSLPLPASIVYATTVSRSWLPTTTNPVGKIS